FDEAHERDAGAERAHEEDRQQAVDHLRGDIHEHGHEADRPDAARHGLEAARNGAGRQRRTRRWKAKVIPSRNTSRAAVRILTCMIEPGMAGASSTRMRCSSAPYLTAGHKPRRTREGA